MFSKNWLLIALAVFGCLGLGTAMTARADIVYIGPRVVQPSGQGVVPTVLTLQEKVQARDGIETGAVRRVGGADVVEGEAVLGINSKTILFTSLMNDAGVLNASDLGIYLDIVEPGNDNLLTIGNSNSTVGRNALILTAYKNDGTVLANFYYTGEFRNLTATPGPGGGRSDHVFGLDATQAAQLQALVLANSDLRLGLESTLGSVFGGPDQYFFGSLSGTTITQVPEPASMLLLGTGLAGVAAKLRKRRKAIRSLGA